MRYLFFWIPLLLPFFLYAAEILLRYPEDNLGSAIPFTPFIVDYPPDPVNAQSLNFYLPQEDINYPCYGFDMVITRAYNSFNQFDGLFGIGWTFNHNIRIFERGRKILLMEGDGFTSHYELDEYHDINKKNVIVILINKRKEEDKQLFNKLKPQQEYNDLVKRLETDNEFYTSLKEKYLFKGGTAKPGKYISTTRGKSWVLKDKNGSYLRTMLSGRTEYFNKLGQITKVTDRMGNTMKYTYYQNNLRTIIDPCGRKISLTFNRYGKVDSIIDMKNRKFAYEYDPKGRLTEAVTPNGRTRYFYSKRNTMVKVTFSDNSETVIKYDDDYRVIEQTVPGKSTKYLRVVDPSDKFHITTKVITSDNKITIYDFYYDENKTIQTNPDGSKEITVVSACCGKPLSRTDAQGKGEFFSYNEEDNLVKREYSSGRIIYYSYESNFNQISSMRYGDGTTIDFVYDKVGNLIQVRSGNGERLDIDYNNRGKITNMVKDKNLKINFRYNSYGKPIEINQDDVGVLVMTYDDFGNTKEVKGQPKPRSKISPEDVKRRIKMTLSYLLQTLQPVGISIY